jgi:hypothetical protein
MIRLLVAWWQMSEAFAGRLTEPRRDPESADQAMCEIVSSSRLFALAHRLIATLALAWRWSLARQVARSIERTWRGWPPTSRVRFVGRCISSAAITVLLLQTVESPQGAPFRWIVPLAVGIGGLLTELLAASVVRRGKFGRG